MPKVVKGPYSERIEEYRLEFVWEGDEGSGFSFECDKDGNLIFSKISKHAYDNLLLSFTDAKVIFVGVGDHSRDIPYGATVECDCGATVHCDDPWANGCDNCNREYNYWGLQLAPRSQWGSEFHTQPEEDEGLYSAENCQ